MDKLQMAHDYAMQLVASPDYNDDMSLVEFVAHAWKYADAMQAEAEKRKPKGLPDALQEEWQPDWSQAPSEYKWFFKQQDGSCHFSSGEPEFLGDAWATEVEDYVFESPISCPVDWEDSLRERPHGF